MLRCYFLLSVFSSIAQVCHAQCDSLPDFNEPAVDARTHHLKSYSLYTYKNEKATKGRLLHTTQYNTAGNITRYEEHVKTGTRKYIVYYVTAYDSLGRVVKEEWGSTYNNSYFHFIDYEYADGRLVKTYSKQSCAGSPCYDTAYYIYSADGRYIGTLPDTGKAYVRGGLMKYCHQYKCLTYMDNEPNDSISKLSITDYGDFIMLTQRHPGGSHLYGYDNRCNRLNYNIIDSNGHGEVTTYLCTDVYNNKDQLTKQGIQRCPYLEDDKCTGKLVEDSYARLEYFDDGLLKRITYYHRNRKIKEIQMAAYEKY